MATPSRAVNPAANPKGANLGRANSLGIDQETLEQVVKKLDQAAPKDSKPKRGFVRWPYPLANLEIVIENPGGGTQTLRVAARNLSCGGIGILHRSYLHPGTKIRVRIRSSTKGIVEIPGTISRCSFKGGVLHDIGARFDKPIDIHDYSNPDLFEERYTLETIKPEDLAGNVLYIEDSAMDARLVKHFLRSTKVELTLVTTCAEAMKVAARGFKVILCDYQLADGDAPEVVRNLRSAGITAPIVVVTSDLSRVMRDSLRKVGTSAFLSKPLSEERVHRALGEFMLAERWSQKLEPLADLDSESTVAMRKAFAEELMAGTQLLVQLVQEKNPKDAYVVCSRLAATARNLECSDLADLADSAGESIAKSMDCEKSKTELGALLAAIDKRRGAA